MADILASALVTAVLGNLNSTALQEIGHAWGLEDELKSIESILSTVQLVLQDAEKKQRKSEAVQNWLMKLKNAAYDAENILNQIAIEGFRRRKGTYHELTSYFSGRNPLLFRYKIVRKVRRVRERLDATVAEERINFHFAEGVMDNRVGGTLESRETSSQVNEREIVGRKEEKEMIIETLLGTTHDDELSVYAIWGMGGLGKTTLAQLVYNDERTERHFDLRIWVCVSDNFSIRRILRAIVESIDQGGCNISALDPLRLYIQEKLRGKRFLLVLDDVWNENDRLWDGLKEVLRCGLQGSVLMVTTRIEKVALMMATISIHHLGYLSKAESWSLFRQRAFATGEEEESLMEIGKGIMEKCGGVPLAVKALGSLMQSKSSEREWLAIRESEIWLLPDDENGILPALRLSYDNLPPHMKQCFAYCCMFPKDYVMNKNKLIELWVANGFLPSEGQTDLYLTGYLIFKELVRRSFFEDFNGKTCKMHNLVHDLAKSVMKHETYIVERGKALKIPKMLRHLYLDVTRNLDVPLKKEKIELPLIASNSLHSLIAHKYELPFKEEDLSSFLSRQQYLRVLHLQRCVPPTSKLPNLICKLGHLRYLAMSCFNRKRLPESLTCLHYLQILKLHQSKHLLELPKGLKHMKNLWFLDIERYDSLLCMPPGLGELTCLQGLSIFIVGQDSATQIDQLKELNLGGKLSIQGLENVRNFEDAKSANLMRKKNLTSLSLTWTRGSKEKSAEYFEEVLEGLQPCKSLEKLYIRSYQGSRFPNWMSTLACKNLTEISLKWCHRCESLPPLGKLYSLVHLKLYQLDSIKHLDAEWHGNGETSFPALTNLTIDGMPNFEEWTIPDSGESFPCLKYLKIRRCPKLNGLPSLPALRSLELQESSVALLRSLVFLTSLVSICLVGFDELNVLPEGLLQDQQALEVLKISRFPNIRTLSNMLDNKSALRTLHLGSCSSLEFLPEGLKDLNSLKKLTLSKCDSLTSFPATILQDLSSLKILEIRNCKRLNLLSGPLQRESALESILIYGCPKLKYLPESMQQFTSLRELRIRACEELRSLRNLLGCLQSLSVVEIWGSKYLDSLPDGFQNLKSLRELVTHGCGPQLEKRCKKSKGEDWPKISHIPKVVINGKLIQYREL